MLHLLFLVFLASASAQRTTISPDVLNNIFGTPPTTQGLESITVQPTTGTSIFTDKAGEECQCVPYYLCDADLNAIDVDNATVTGFGTLDIRFKEDCQESVERCCKNPKSEGSVEIPKPDATRLRGCGYRNPNGVDFSILKNDTDQYSQFGEFPWVVALLNAQNDSCAGVGVLIHPQVVMTGAHNVNLYEPSGLRIRAGEWDTQTVKERLRHQERDVAEIYYHKDFQPKSVKNDMALLRLSEPVQLSDHINVICMPEQDEDFDRYKGCVANGWGKNVFGERGRYAVILKKVEQDMVDRTRCTQLLQRTRLGPRFKLHSSFVCAGGEEGKDTCQGDGGAPLACPLGDDRYKLTGLVAWGIECGKKDVPAVYVNVAAFRQWVDDQMAKWQFDISGYRI